MSKAIGGFYAPYQIERMAKAEANAAIIKAQNEIQITDLHRRAMHRFIEEEAQKQQNIETITNKAIPLLADKADASKLEDDWVTNFFDKSRIVSDLEMQDLWARVLACEANVPGTYSKRTVNFLGDLDKLDAELFAKLCGFGWRFGDVVPLVFDVKADIYNKSGIDFNSLSHLDAIGLIHFTSFSEFNIVKLPKRFNVIYYGDILVLEMPYEAENQLAIGSVRLTRIGQELAPICGSKPVPGFIDYVKLKWEAYLPKPKPVEAVISKPPA